MMEVKKYSLEFGGKTLSVEFGRLAGLANGSCFVQYGETAVLVTATMSAKPKEVDYLPLSVDYEEKYYAAGKIKGSKWLKRDGRPSEEAILSSRLIDRSIRPRFDHNVRNEIQVVATVLSFDKKNDPDMPALFGASLALMTSDIPFDGPVSSVRIGKIDGRLIFNPTYEERILSEFDIVVAGTISRINMLEAGVNIVPEDEVSEAVSKAFDEIQKLNSFQQKIAAEIAKPKQSLSTYAVDNVFVEEVRNFARPLLEKGLYTKDKQEYVANVHQALQDVRGFVLERHGTSPDGDKKLEQAVTIFEDTINNIVHENILVKDRRPDGRKLDQLRDISVDVDILPYTHGSGLFNRGNTQALSILTLASPGMEQWIETMEIDLTKKRFMHHYTFPPFSVGEVGRVGGLGRRDIGHGALAERALLPIIPNKDEFPYTIRVVSEILSSNGSSSMASVCGSILALMDGGVPIKDMAAGIAMGIMFDSKGENYKILTDIQGAEDHHGDMDLKVAGTKDGITALQMDVKIDGITPEIFEQTLVQARKARLEILDVMRSKINTPRSELAENAPRIKIIKIDPAKIGAVIGKGGETINRIVEETDAVIDIEEDGSVYITSVNKEGADRAIAMIEQLTYEPNIGDKFDGKVTRILDFGAFVEYLPGKEGMVHVSEISGDYVKKPSDVLKTGQDVKVMIKNIDDMGRVNLTIKGYQ